MLTLILLLSLLNVQKVWLKPTGAYSEGDKMKEDDQTRSKRQAIFFELLHQAIENYGNCADESLAPFKVLAAYKPYNVSAYPGQYSPTFRTHQEETGPIMKCSNVEVCSITDEYSPPDDSIPALYRDLDDWEDNSKDSLSGSNYFESRNMSPDEQINFIKNDPIQNISNRFSHTPPTANGNQIIKNNTEQKTNQTFKQPYTDPPDLRENMMGGKESVDAMKPESPPSRTIYKVITPGKVKSCLCSNITGGQQSEEPLGIMKSDSELCTCFETSVEPQWFENLNSLFSQLDIMTHKETKEDLLQILNKLKSLRSAFRSTETENNCRNSTALQDPYLVGSAVPNTSFIARVSEDFENERDTNTEQLITTLTPINNLKESISHNSTEDATSSPALERIKSKIKVLMSFIASRSSKKKSEANVANRKTNDTESMTENYNPQKVNPLNAKKNDDLLAKKLNESLVIRRARFNKNDSRVTVSLTSSGKFKKISVGQKLPALSDTNSEERENENFDTYTEPILSELHTANFKTKPPFSIYWHRIEKKPLKLEKSPRKMRETSADLYDNNRSKAKSHSAIFQEDVADYENGEYES